MTDIEIIKALKCCEIAYDQDCTECPLYPDDGEIACREVLREEAHDLITRQQAEIENLKVENQSLRSAANSLKMHYEEAQAEVERLKKTEIEIDDFCRRLCRMRMLNGNAIASYEDLQNYIQEEKLKAVKEFAERLKEKSDSRFDYSELVFEISEGNIDNLLKETEGENNDL